MVGCIGLSKVYGVYMRQIKGFIQIMWFLIGLMGVVSPVYAALEKVAAVNFSRGVVAAQQPDKSPRLIAKGADIYVQDNIQTSDKSFAILAFSDGGKITIRPNSSFSISEYIDQQDKKKATFDLHKGGIRASTGRIAEKFPENYQIKTELTSIGAQQADYSVRLCTNDCAKESQTIANKQQSELKTEEVAARIVKLYGEVLAQAPNAESRHLSIGAPLYLSDRIISQADSYALLVFRDEGRISIQANSEFSIKHYQYKKESEQDQAVYQLITGGLRVLTGKIGKANKASFAVNTPVATIGIRGTGFDLLCLGEGCSGECDSEEDCKLDPSQQINDSMQGLHTYVWDSAITQTNERGTFDLSAPNSNYIANIKMPPQRYTETPEIFQNNITPRPDKVDVKDMNLFDTTTLKGLPSGVYVTVHNGHVQLNESLTLVGNHKKDSGVTLITVQSDENKSDKQVTHLGRNEVAYIDTNGDIARLDQLKSFQTEDPYPLPNDLNMEQTMEVGVYSLLVDDVELTEDAAYQCAMQ